MVSLIELIGCNCFQNLTGVTEIFKGLILDSFCHQENHYEHLFFPLLSNSPKNSVCGRKTLYILIGYFNIYNCMFARPVKRSSKTLFFGVVSSQLKHQYHTCQLFLSKTNPTHFSSPPRYDKRLFMLTCFQFLFFFTVFSLLFSFS